MDKRAPEIRIRNRDGLPESEVINMAKLVIDCERVYLSEKHFCTTFPGGRVVYCRRVKTGNVLIDAHKTTPED